MSAGFTLVIPVRYDALRLPGKPLRMLAGKPLVQHTWEQAHKSSAEAVFIATDDKRIQKEAAAFGAEVLLTSPDHQSGTERVQEAAALLGLPPDALIVNLQGDEPGMPPAVIDQVAALVTAGDAGIATLCRPLQSVREIFSPHLVKVVRARSGRALYFSRAPVPWAREHFPSLDGEGVGALQALPSDIPWERHVGLYAYRAGVLREWGQLPPAPIERAEQLEQLRPLWHGLAIQVEEARLPVPPGVDTEEEYRALCQQMEGGAS